jgi:hypothetical protein
MGQSNPSKGCCGMVTPCCPGEITNPVATIWTTGDCECAPVVSVPLSEKAQNTWEGSAPYGSCGKDVTVRWYCEEVGPEMGYSFFLDVSFSDSCLVATRLEATSSNCQPLQWDYLVVVGGSCCSTNATDKITASVT